MPAQEAPNARLSSCPPVQPFAADLALADVESILARHAVGGVSGDSVHGQVGTLRKWIRGRVLRPRRRSRAQLFTGEWPASGRAYVSCSRACLIGVIKDRQQVGIGIPNPFYNGLRPVEIL